MHMGYIFLAIAALIAFPENPLARSAAMIRSKRTLGQILMLNRILSSKECSAESF